MGDSLNVINWINETQECRQLRLAHILFAITLLLQCFDSSSCRHVYREYNKEADKASKEGLRLAAGTWTVKEFIEGSTQDFYHRPFIDILWLCIMHFLITWNIGNSWQFLKSIKTNWQHVLVSFWIIWTDSYTSNGLCIWSSSFCRSHTQSQNYIEKNVMTIWIRCIAGRTLYKI